MADRTPQQFPDGDPDGVTDNTTAIQAAIDAWQAGDQVVLSGGTFRITSNLLIPHHGLIIKGDAILQAASGFSGGTMIVVSGDEVVFDADGLQLDQADNIASGVTIRASASGGLGVHNVMSRNTQQAFLQLDSNTSEVLVQGCDHFGAGHGIAAFDAAGLVGITLRNNRFEHPGTGAAGDGVRLHCASHGASDVTIVDCVARGYIGEATDQGVGFGFSRVTDGRIIGSRAEDCEGDGFRFENGCLRWLCADVQALDIGAAGSIGGHGSGLIAYDSDEVSVVLMIARNCAFHGIALSGQGQDGLSTQLRRNGLIERCHIETTRRDGIHLTAQRDFRIDRNHVRDPSLGNPGLFAGIHIGQQGGTAFENVDGIGNGNVVSLTGASTPLGTIVVRPLSINVTIDGISSSGIAGQPFADGGFWTDATGWVEAA